MGHQPLRVPGLPIYVEQVVNGQGGSPVIGIKHSSQDRQEAVMFRQSLEADLTAWLQQKMPQRPSDHVLALCFRQLRIGEAPRASTRNLTPAIGTVAIDVFERLPDGYHFVRQIASHSSGGIESTYLPSYLLAQLLQRSLMQLADTDWTRPRQQPALSLAQLTAPVPAKASSRAAILRASAPRRGVYFSFEQFLTNRPDTTTRLSLDTLRSDAKGWEGTIRLQPTVYRSNGQRVGKHEVWGYSDGRQAYLRHNNSYRALTRQGDFFTFVGPAPHKEVITMSSPQPMGMGTGTTTVPAQGYFNNDNSSPPVAYALDMRSGLGLPYPRPGQPPRADTAFVYVYRPLGGQAEARSVLVDDREVGQLRPGQFLEVTCTGLTRPMRVSTGTPGGPALLFLPDAATANYLKLVSSSAISPWQYMLPRQGEAEVDALEKQRK